MKKSELAFSAILVPVDYVTLLVAGLVAYDIRFTTIAGLRPVTEVLSHHVYVNALLIVAAVWIGIFALSGMYTIRGVRRAVDEISSIFMACSTGILLVIVSIFFQRELFASRFVVLMGWVLAVVFVVIERAVVRGVQAAILRRGIGAHYLIVIGRNGTASDIVSYLRAHPSLGYRVTERYDEVNQHLFDTLTQLMQTTRIDEVILADTGTPKDQVMLLNEFCNERHLVFRYAADLLEAQTNIDIQTLAGIPVIEIKRTKLDGWGKILKRGFDILGAVVLLVLFSPAFLVVALCIKLDSEGPIIIRLQRVGEGGRIFTLFKFRSMVKNAQAMKEQLMEKNERDGPLFKMKNDPRVTRVGKFIRKTSLDELPQFVNVFLGSMSLVGPRPHEPAEVARYDTMQRRLLTIKPGVTGMAQTSGRSDLSFADETRLDLFYIENWSFTRDLQILSKTPWVVLSMRSAV